MNPRHESESLSRKQHQNQKPRKITHWPQFVYLGLTQHAGRISLRNVVSHIKVQAGKLYQSGCGEVNRFSLACVNEQQPHELYKALPEKLLARCLALTPKHSFRFRNKLYSHDAFAGDLCITVLTRGNSGPPPRAQSSSTSG